MMKAWLITLLVFWIGFVWALVIMDPTTSDEVAATGWIPVGVTSATLAYLLWLGVWWLIHQL